MGWRSSQIIWRTQKCLCPHRFLRTKIRNVLRKWTQNLGRTFFIHFPKDRNCEVCLRTKITRAPCRRRTGEVLPRAQQFGDLITADHKVFNEEGESRNNHLYAVVARSCHSVGSILSVQNKNFSGDGQEFKKVFLEPSQSQKSFTQTIHWSLENSVKNYHGTSRTSTPHRSETNGIADRAVRRGKEGTSAVLLQSGSHEKCRMISWNYFAICAMSKTSWRMGKLP